MMLDHLTVNETESADLNCTVTGTPRPNIAWYMLTDSSNGTVEVIENTRYTIVEAVSTGGDKNMQVVSVLTISNTTMDDTGVYTCNATNVQGSDVDSGRLDVQCEYCPASHGYKQMHKVYQSQTLFVHYCYYAITKWLIKCLASQDYSL